VNGRQKDPYKEKLPEADPIKEEYKEDYMKAMKVVKARLDAIPVEGLPAEAPESIMASTKETKGDAGA